MQFDATGWRWRTVCFGWMRFLSTCARTLAVALQLLTSLHGMFETSSDVRYTAASGGNPDTGPTSL